MSVLQFSTQGDIAVVTLDNPPVNAASHALRAALWAAIDRVNSDPAITAALLIGAGRGFVAGADIAEFNTPPQPPLLGDLINHLAASPKPWLAALHGQALGGGLELALGSHYRIATPDCRLGLPEVTLGLIPGAGGTVRLPRLIAAQSAVEMITSGKPVTGTAALHSGLVDALAEGDLLQDALGFAQTIATRSLPVPLAQRSLRVDSGALNWDAIAAKTAARARGQTAPMAAVSLMRAAQEMTADDALAAERAAFTTLKASDQSRALRHVFAAERRAARPAMLQGITATPITTTAVIGGGTMGSGIATALLLAGYPVQLVERDAPALAAGLARVAHNLDGALQRGLISPDAHRRHSAALAGCTDYAGLADRDLVIEAVFEDFTVKQQLLAALETHCRPTAILASNTSYLDLDALAASMTHPARLIGLHFFAPAHIMKLLEIIRPAQAAPEAVAAGFALAKRLGKIAVLAGVCDGFIGNRIMSSYRRECEYLLADGASPGQIDAAMRAFGLPMGVFEMQDLSGLDIAYAMRQRRAASRDPAERYIPIADRLVEAGQLGRKTGAGWYLYPDGKTASPNPDAEAIITAYRREAGLTPTRFTEDQIMARILAAMQAEGSAVLDDGIAQSGADIDVVMIHGYGFPRWRGGPIYMLDQEAFG